MSPYLRKASILLSAILLAFLAACGGGGSGTPVAATPAPVTSPPSAGSSSVDATTSYARSNTPPPTDVGLLLKGLGVRGFFDARVTVDLDGDGVPEIFVATGNGTPNAQPSRIFRRQADGSYSDATSGLVQGAVPAFVHPRKAISADFNGDGRPDIYVLDHGYDFPPFPGSRNGLLLSDTATGRLAAKSIPTDIVGFHHCGSAGDVDGNGTIDIFVCSDGWQSTATEDKSSYILLNDGRGNFTASRVGVPASMARAGLATSELIDIDQDGRLDLIIGYALFIGGRNERLTTIFWGDGTGRFSDANSQRLPLDSTFNTAYDVKVGDIDGDGRRDLIVLAVRENLTGYYVHVFRQTAARTFVDESQPRIIKDRATWDGNTAGWFPWLHLTDLDGNGSLDLAAGDSSAFVPARGIKWTNDGRGVFTRTGG